jgi:glyoxylase I family protein
MKVRGAHHVSLPVRDLSRSRVFYEELLGLTQIERPHFGIAGAWYQAGPVQLHLIEVPGGSGEEAEAPSASPLSHHLAFEVDEAALVQRELEAAGLDVMAIGSEAKQLFVPDPDGNTIEFIET